MAFRFAYDYSGAPVRFETIVVKDTVVLSRGELLNLESGEVDTAATADTALIGIATEAVDNTNDGLSVKVITNPFAVYAVDNDAVARTRGDTLDIATGGLGVTTTNNADLIVVEDSTASEETLVTFAGSHYLQL